MATVGISIGASFMVALVAGPIIASFIGVAGIFWLMVGLALVGIVITEFVVPHPRRVRVHRDAETVPALIGAVLRNSELLRLDFGIFALHAMLTASFLVVPGLLRGTLGVPVHDQWIVWLPVLIVSVAIMVPGDHRGREAPPHEGRVRGAVAALVISQAMLYLRRRQSRRAAGGAGRVLLGLQHHGGEPALAHHQGGAARRQGHRHRHLFELAVPRHFRRRRGRWLGASARRHGGVFALTAALALLWLMAAATMAQPSYLTTRLMPIADGKAADADSLAARLRQVPGVAEAVVIAEEKLAYLKVDSKAFDAAKAEAVAGGA